MFKFLIATVLIGSFALADNLQLRRPVGTPFMLNTATSNVTTTAWVRLGVTDQPCSALLLGNTGVQTLILAKGLSGAEIALSTWVPTNPMMIPLEIGKSVAISLKALSGSQASGIVSAACFQ